MKDDALWVVMEVLTLAGVASGLFSLTLYCDVAHGRWLFDRSDLHLQDD